MCQLCDQIEVWRRKKAQGKRAVEARIEKGSEVKEKKTRPCEEKRGGYDNSHRTTFPPELRRNEVVIFTQFLVRKSQCSAPHHLLLRLFQGGLDRFVYIYTYVRCFVVMVALRKQQPKTKTMLMLLMVFSTTCNKAQATARRHEEKACVCDVLLATKVGDWAR